MSCLIKMCLDGKSKTFEYNRAYIDICIYDDEVISLPNFITLIKTTAENTQVTIDSDLIKGYEILTESVRLKSKNEKNKADFDLNHEQCKVIFYPKDIVIYRGQEIDCYAILIWHLDRDTLRLIDRSCRF